MKRSRHQILQSLSRLSTWQVAVGSSAGLVTIWSIDYAIRTDLGLSIFYVLPIAAVTWYIKPAGGYLMSGLSAILWFLAEAARMPSDPNLFVLVWNTCVRLAFWVIVVFLLGELKSSYRKEQRLASTDFMTGLLNRRAFMDDIEQEIKRSSRYRFPFTLAYLDVDNFKQVNDRLGHAAGDSVLQAIASVLVSTLRATDLISRLGGDEFAILMPQTNRAEADTVLTRLFHELNGLTSTDAPIGFSIGAVTFLTTPESADQALAKADKLMYAVKEKGKNQVTQTVY